MLTEYPIFAEYHYYTKLWLSLLMYLPRLRAVEVEIPVVYSTPRRAFSMGDPTNIEAPGHPLVEPPDQGNNFRPVLTFHLSGMTQKIEYSPPFEHILTAQRQDNNDNVIGSKNAKLLLVYEITYTASLYCGLMQDADMLMFHFATEFRPACNLWIGDQTAKGDGLKGKWAHMVIDGITDASEYETGDIAERIVRKDLSWRVTEAYVPTIEPDFGDDVIQKFMQDIYKGESPIPEEILD